MNGQGINIKDKKTITKTLVGYITFNPAKIISVTAPLLREKVVLLKRQTLILTLRKIKATPVTVGHWEYFKNETA